MKQLAVLLAVLTMVGCASTRYNQQAATVEQLTQINKKLNESDCPRIDYWVNFAETQEKMRGVYGKAPEDLNEEDRMYHAQTRIIIWSLRVGCVGR